MTANQQEQIRLSFGIAVYDPHHDHTVSDVIGNIDRIMYENKRQRRKEGDNAVVRLGTCHGFWAKKQAEG